MGVRAITFDFWNTLFRDANSEPRQRLRVDALASSAGVSQEEASRALKAVWAEFARSHIEEQRTLTPNDAVRLAGASLGVVVEEPAFSRLAEVFATAILVHSPEPIENALKAVRAAAEFLPVGLISDTGVSPGDSLRRLLARHDFTPSFSAMTYSDEIGVSKPKAPMFQASARELGVAPDELFHIGDLERTDIIGAKGVGARAGLFLSGRDGKPDSTRADCIFATWKEFMEQLPALLT